MKTSVGVSYAAMLRKNKLGELLGHPNVKPRTISSQANQGWLEGSETSESILEQRKSPRAPSPLVGEDIVQTIVKAIGLRDKEPLAKF